MLAQRENEFISLSVLPMTWDMIHDSALGNECISLSVPSVAEVIIAHCPPCGPG